VTIAVVGAGVAGLATAFEIVRQGGAGTDVRVVEASPRAGGNLRTETIDGYVLEWGPNGFLDSAPDTLALVDALGLRSRVVVSSDAARKRFLYRGGRLHQLPESPPAFLTSPLLSLAGRLRVLGEPFARRRPDGDETIHAFAARRIGREAADVLIDAMVSGVFGGNARELSLRACFPKMWEMETEHGGLVRAMLARRRARTRDAAARAGEGLGVASPTAGAPPPAPAPAGGAAGPAGRLTSFVGGVQDLVDALVAALPGRVRTSARVISLGGGSTARWRVALHSGEAIDADAVVLAAGAAATAPVVDALDGPLASVLREIPSAPMVVAALGYDADSLGHALDGFGFLVPRGEGLRILGALWDSSVYPGCRAPSGAALLRVMLGGAHDPGALALDDDEVLALVRSELRAAMGIGQAPRFVRIFRHPVGIPQYTVGHPDRLARIDAALARHPGLFVAGNSYRGVAINACVTEASPLAARVLAATR
jgi:oxygen-dependent protoporphyrinogen oxidase